MLKISVCRAKKKTLTLSTLKNQKEYLVVWWYGGIRKNRKAMSVPNLIVFFREMRSDGTYRRIIPVRVDLTSLGLLSIGSIWCEGISESELSYQTETFELDFSEYGWEFTSPWESYKKGHDTLISEQDYRLYYQKDKNWLIRFNLNDGRRLLVPCIEYFARCYGRSDEARRIIATYPWDEAIRRLSLPTKQPRKSNKWLVKLAKDLVRGDSIFVAHILYNKYAERAAREVYAQIETAFNESNLTAFIKVRPWFEGPAKLMVKGLWINKNRTFLALQIAGCSDPNGNPIYRSRNRMGNPITSDTSKIQNNIAEKHLNILSKIPDIITITDYDDPCHNAPTIELETRGILTLGNPRKIFDVRDRNSDPNYSRKTFLKAHDVDNFTSGDRYGSGNNLGRVLSHSRVEFESEGVLRDMWNAQLYMKQTYSDIIKAVEWFTFDNGFSDSKEPQIIGLNPFDDGNDEIPTDIRNWLYLDLCKKTPRGVLVTRVTTNQGTAYIVEIQRRSKRNTSYGNTPNSEESFKGLVFTLNDQRQFNSYLGKFLSDVRHVRGIVSKLTRDFPGDAKTFKHVTSSHEQISCEAAVKNALVKVALYNKIRW